MINFRFIANLMGRLLLIESAFLLLCVLIALIYGEHDASAFFYTSLITMSAGFLLSKLIKIKDRVLAKKDGYFMVTMVWIISLSSTQQRPEVSDIPSDKVLA